MSIKLSKRMKTIADMVTAGNVVADIGCDHGYISIYLVEQHLAKRVIAMDVAKGPLDIAKKNIEASGLSDKIDVRLSDGFEAMEAGESDGAVIAGMGGNLIIDILKNGLHKFTDNYELVLSPQSDVPLVRGFLREVGFVITDEDMLTEDGKYYNVIKAKKTEDAITTRVLEDKFGQILIEKKHPVLKEFLEKQMQTYQGIFCRLSKSSGEKSADRMAELRQELSEMEEVLKQL